MKRVAVTGITGFVGRGLPALLAERGFAVTGISRAGRGDVPGVDEWRTPENTDFAGLDAIINLAGEPVSQRWTDEAKERFRASRVDATRRIVSSLEALPPERRPRVLVSASAVGYYGDRGGDFLTEDAAPGEGFLADLCRDWEKAARGAEALGVRVVSVRIGIVLGNGGGALGQMAGIFKWGLGGKLGNGNQWMPWIHIDDLRAALVHAVCSDSLSGPANGTAPSPEKNADFTRKLASALHRPAVFRVPATALKLGLGEFSSALLDSQRAIPQALVEDGFDFRFGTLEEALADLLGR